MTAPFGEIVMVDWSANSTPKSGADSIWISHLDVDRDVCTVWNPRTRLEAADDLRGVAGDARGRMLVGFDFPLGYPTGFAAAARLDGDRPWLATWEHLAGSLVDGPRNANNRWAVAAGLNERIGAPHFWGAPRSAAGPWLTSRRPVPWPVETPGLPLVRRSETVLLAGGLRPFTVWQLLGAGSVGSQALTGIPIVHRLRGELGASVWPFDTGLASPEAPIVVAEVWPSMVDFSGVDHPVKDARQVVALARRLAAHQADGTLDGLFAPALAPADRRLVVEEEGWVLGVGPPG